MPSGRTKTVTLGYKPKIILISMVDSSNATEMNVVYNDYRPSGTHQVVATFGNTSDAIVKVSTMTNNTVTYVLAGVAFTLTITSTGFTFSADSYVMDLAWGYIAST